METYFHAKTVVGHTHQRTRKRNRKKVALSYVINNFNIRQIYAVPNTTYQGHLSNTLYTRLVPREKTIQKKKIKKPKLTGRLKRQWQRQQKRILDETE